MARKIKESEIEELVGDWISVNRQENPAEWEAWRRWRADNLGAQSSPENFTVPSDFPPATIVAAKEYAEAIQKLRKANGWTESRAKINIGAISAFMG